MKRLLSSLLLAVALWAQDPLDGLRPDHPRVMATADDFARLRQLRDHDADFRRYYSMLQSETDRIFAQPPVEYVLIGPRLLDQSRRALDRVYRLAFLWRMEGDRRYLDRAVAELHAAAQFPDWNPSHFLDTAEMSHAFAIGYDWLYDGLDDAQRDWIALAIVDLGLRPGLQRYALNGRGDGWWWANPFNWNLVCNGGLTAAALAIADREPEMAARVIGYAVKGAPAALSSYEPEGGWAEGPGYWDYATRYAGVLIHSLQTALGHDFSLSHREGLAQAGDFRVFTASPLGRTFNYADSGDGLGPSWALAWLARRYQQPVYSWFELRMLTTPSRVDPLHLVFFPDGKQEPDRLPSRMFRGVDAAVLRSSWTDRNGLFFAIKGGDNAANHSHLDLGSFVLDLRGQRWALDLGSDNYNLPAYFGDLRWTYYRLRTESHNTLLLNHANQNLRGKAPIVDSSFEGDEGRVVVDLTGAYPQWLNSLTRTAEMQQGRRIVLTDTIDARQEIEPLWGMVTAASVALPTPQQALLTQSGQRLSVRIESPPQAFFEVLSTQPANPDENQNRNTRKLVVRFPERLRNAEIRVVFE